MTTVNEMIFATLKTKSDKPARYAEQLQMLGYEVTNPMRDCGDGPEPMYDYWGVNDLRIKKNHYNNDPVYLYLRGRHYERLDRIKKIDFVDYFNKYDERQEKSKRMAAHDSIREIRRYERVTLYHPYRRIRTCIYFSENLTVKEYEELKREATREVNYWEGRVNSALESLKYASERLAEEKAEAKEYRKELNAFLREHKVR